MTIQESMSGERPRSVALAERNDSGVDPVTIARAVTLAESIRLYGHFQVKLDSFGPDPAPDERLDAAAYGLSDHDLARLPAVIVRGPLTEGVRDAGAAIAALRRVYAGRIGYEFAHLVSAKERQWLERAIEREQFAPNLRGAEAKQILERLTAVETFERLIHKAFVGQKRFSIEGLDITLPMVEEVITASGAAGIKNVALGMAHRGRLAFRVFVGGTPVSEVWQAFLHATDYEQHAAPDPGDVKYHLGSSSKFRGDDTAPTVHLRPNPSHLEWVNPTVEGYARAFQDDRSQAGAPSRDDRGALTILIHGDAAFPGEGIVAETFNIAELAGYTTGGTIHVISNNNIGFTTNPDNARSTAYSSDLAKGFNLPILHVNADDPEACIAAIRLAFAWREEFGRDVVIDVVGYRRWGHNEGDEPLYTQPVRYTKIAAHPTVRTLWARTLESRGEIEAGEADRLLAEAEADLQRAVKGVTPLTVGLPPAPSPAHLPASTGITADRLVALNGGLMQRPAGFQPMPKLEHQLQRSRGTLDAARLIDWGHAEALAFASILEDGMPIRLTGQDAERGTFAHRHAVLHDVTNDSRFVPLQAHPLATSSFAIHNSPLSEGAVLGFEFGYSQAARDALVLWEAQFGDFANTAQVTIDQFISSSYAKWRDPSSIVMLLPHGYEGQGPEHSSARIERYLQLFAEDNMHVVLPSTAAQYFHLLRHQAARIRAGEPRPLIVFTPKSLLRSPAASAHLDDLTHGTFQPVLDDREARTRAAEITRVVLCSGKIGIELLTSEARKKSPHVAIVRIEQLAPFPFGPLKAVLATYPNLEEVYWVQEEPRNMGPFNFVHPRIKTQMPPEMPFRYVGRLDQASPAEGSQDLHAYNQHHIIERAFAD